MSRDDPKVWRDLGRGALNTLKRGVRMLWPGGDPRRAARQAARRLTVEKFLFRVKKYQSVEIPGPRLGFRVKKYHPTGIFSL